MVGIGGFNPGAYGLSPGSVQSNGDDFQALGMPFAAQGLPHGQVKTTPSPRSPGDQEHFLSAQLAQRNRGALQIGQDDVGESRAAEHTPDRFRPEAPHIM